MFLKKMTVAPTQNKDIWRLFVETPDLKKLIYSLFTNDVIGFLKIEDVKPQYIFTGYEMQIKIIDRDYALLELEIFSKKNGYRLENKIPAQQKELITA